MLDYIRNLLPAIFENLPLLPDQASTMAGQVDLLTFTWVVISFISGTIVVAMLFYFMVRYRRRAINEVGGHETHAPAVEVISMAIPFVIVMVMFAWGTKVFIDMKRLPEDAVEYLAFGKQWMWKYQHPNGLREINNLTIPVHTRIKLTMTSEDVIHSVFIPAFRIKQDVIPGRYTTMWFEATKTGQFHLFCAEYCGSEHSYMRGKVTVLEKEEYEAWLRNETPNSTPASNGEDLFTSLACSTCHTGEPSGRGPSLHGLFGSQVTLASGETVTVDESYIRESIVEPRARIVSGYLPLMPTFKGQVTEEQVIDLITYIKSLEAGATVADAEDSAGDSVSGG